MRKFMKVLHTFAACGMVGALLAYGIVLAFAPHDTAQAVAAARQTIAALCSYLLLPAMGAALISGLLSMAIHRPFQEQRWVWLKALLGLSVFEATLGIIQSKANDAAALSAKIAAGAAEPGALKDAVDSEWMALGVIITLAVANIVLGVWRPRLARR